MTHDALQGVAPHIPTPLSPWDPEGRRWAGSMAELAAPQNRHGAENRTERADDLGIAFPIAPTWFDPAETPGLITPYMFLYAMHDALVKPMPEGPMTPCLATQWSESADGLAYDFALRQGVKFRNGDPLTAEDVQFSFERYKGASAKETKQRVKEVEIVNPHHVRFKLHEPWPDFMTFYGSPATGAGWIVPKNYTEKVGSEKFKEQPVGLGPYRFVSHQAGVELMMEAHADYWRKVPHVKRLVFKGVPEATTRLAMLKQQEADVAYGFLGALGEEVRLGAFAYSKGSESWIKDPEIDAWYEQQVVERDRTKREAPLHKIQQKLYDDARFIPIWEYASLCASGPRVAVSGLGLIPLCSFSGPYEDVQLKS